MKCFKLIPDIPVLVLAKILLTTQLPVAQAESDSTSNALDSVDAFEKLFGVTEGKRRNHTKGFCFNATLSPADAEIRKYSNSELFTGDSKVIGRLSHKGGKSAPSDAKPGQYGMSLAITTSSKAKNMMAMNTEDFFPVSTPEAFIQLLRAKAQGKEAVKAFKQNSPELQRYSAHMAKRSKELKPYEGITYNSVSSFYLVNDKNTKTAVKWSFIPTGEHTLNTEPSQDFFHENMQKNLDKGKVVWDMVITIANQDDIVDNPSVQWTGKHKTVTAAKLTVSSISNETDGNCDEINFDPTILSKGLEPSADPLFKARRDIYAIAFGKRLREKTLTNSDHQ